MPILELVEREKDNIMQKFRKDHNGKIIPITTRNDPFAMFTLFFA